MESCLQETWLVERVLKNVMDLLLRDKNLFTKVNRIFQLSSLSENVFDQVSIENLI
jgi:hypothetical protein